MITILSSLLIHASTLHAALVKKEIEYHDGDQVLVGYLVYDGAVKAKRPGVVVIHDWMGLTPENKRKVEETARLGYVAFGADIFGKGHAPKDAGEAAKLAGQWRGDRAALRRRANAALVTLSAQTPVDTKKLGVTGYCFGGTTALELARAGAPLNAVITFHGGLDALTPADARNIKGRVLVLHGADDPMAKPEDVRAFQDELRQAKVDWQMIEYGGAVHSFTIKSAGDDNSKGAAYNAAADRRSWIAAREFLKEAL